MSDTNWGFSQTFLVDFQSTRSDLQTRVDALKLTNATPAQQSLHDLTVDLAKLGKRLSDATGSLPNYDQRQCELQIKNLENELSALRASSAPKSKFAFKKKKVLPSSTAAPVAPEPAVQTADISALPLSESSSHLSLSHQSKAYLGWSLIPTASSAQCDLTISNLDHCIVNLLPISNGTPDETKGTNISAIHIYDVSNSILLLPMISGSVLLHNLQNSIVVIGCHQFRMHTSNKVDVYIEIPSNPIIEHCSGIRFAPYPAILSQSPTKLLHHSSTQASTFAVQDFSHIRETPSPNWTTLKESDWTTAWPVQTTDNTAVVDVLEGLCPK
ncbi:hypothetical protein BDN72DRAFT_757507 [Pluteus cervinus]|uniref:Uncharacterized protein n=1 Tax=Pluteus cervinus TaxID=181527 RepID=A0ACD3BCJ8_9AGAR|nr:hypothetical protein BDN72DRAFT_757507 [Pluteus cervinus]